MNCWPEGLKEWSGNILQVANQQVILEFITNIDEHNPVNWLGLYQALYENKKELVQFTEGESNPEASDKEGEEGRIIKVIKVIPLVPGSLSSKGT